MTCSNERQMILYSYDSRLFTFQERNSKTLKTKEIAFIIQHELKIKGEYINRIDNGRK